MKKFGILFLAFVIVFMFSLSVSAAPIGISAGAKEMKGTDYISEEHEIAFSAAIEGDFVQERSLDGLEGEAEASFYTARLAVSMPRLELYATLGQARDVKYDALVGGASIKYELEDKLTWGAGLSCLIYEWEALGLKFLGDAKYRTIEDMGYESVTLERVEYSPESFTSGKEDATWEEWQGALSVAKKIGYIVPYVGIKYSDVDASAKVTLTSVVYDMGSLNAGENIGAFAGCAIMPVENMSIDLEGRFMEEEAFSISLVYEF